MSALGAAGVAGVGLSLPAARALAAEEPKLNFYNWDTYIGETTLADFKDASGVDVKMDLFADNSELFAKMREGNPGYDVIVPTNDYVDRMRAAKMLQPLDHGKIPNFANIAENFRDAGFDPGRKLSMPYMWGTMGIGYRKSKMDRPTSWSSVLGAGLRQTQGQKSPGSASPPACWEWRCDITASRSTPRTRPKIAAAADQLIKFKDNVRTVAEDNGQDLLASGECDIVVEWSGDIAQLKSEDPDVDYVIPNEGSYVWQDCLCVPVGAPHPENAHAFINFLLDAEVGRDLAEFIEYAHPQRGGAQAHQRGLSQQPRHLPLRGGDESSGRQPLSGRGALRTGRTASGLASSPPDRRALANCLRGESERMRETESWRRFPRVFFSPSPSRRARGSSRFLSSPSPIFSCCPSPKKTGVVGHSLTFTPENYLRVLEPVYLGVFAKSLLIASAATVVCLIVGYPVALAIAFAPQKT